MSIFQQIKLVLIDHSGLAKDALHIYVGLTVFLAASIAFKRPLSSWLPWLAALTATVIGELWDLRDSLYYHTPVDAPGHRQDLWNTMFWPTVLMLLARWNKLNVLPVIDDEADQSVD